MKKDIHPQFFENAVVSCVCGETFITGSTKKEIKVEICSKCHPYFTGKQKIVDSAKRVEKFKRKYKKQENKPSVVVDKEEPEEISESEE